MQHAHRLLAILDQTSHVALHLLNFGEEANKIEVDSRQEISQRALDLLHLEFNANNALMELLTDVSCARVVLVLGNQNLVGLHVRYLLLPQLDVVIGGALVNDLDVRVLVAHDLVLDGTLIPVPRFIPDVAVDQWVLREDLAHEEFLRKSKGINVGLCNVHKLSLRVVAQVVVAEEGVTADLVRNLERHFIEGLLIGVEADANCAVNNKVHLENLFFFVIDDVFIIFVAEMARLQPKGHIVQELAILVLLRVEKEAEVVENVVKEVMDDDASLNLTRQGINELIVFLDLAEPIVQPVVLEMLIDLAIEGVGQGLVAESRQQSHPVVQVEGLLLVAKVLVESRDDFDERAHDVGEEGNAAKHDEYAENHLNIRFG